MRRATAANQSDRHRAIRSIDSAAPVAGFGGGKST